MNLHEYLSAPGSLTVAQLARAIGVKSEVQVRQWQHGYSNRKPGPAYCMAIEVATNGAVTRGDLRPDAHLIWPELAEPTTQEATHG